MRFFELFVVLAFAVGWGILELVAKRFDKPSEKLDDHPTDPTMSDRTKTQFERSEY